MDLKCILRNICLSKNRTAGKQFATNCFKMQIQRDMIRKVTLPLKKNIYSTSWNVKLNQHPHKTLIFRAIEILCKIKNILKGKMTAAVET
jgi:hypothetical protein